MHVCTYYVNFNLGSEGGGGRESELALCASKISFEYNDKHTSYST